MLLPCPNALLTLPRVFSAAREKQPITLPWICPEHLVMDAKSHLPPGNRLSPILVTGQDHVDVHELQLCEAWSCCLKWKPVPIKSRAESNQLLATEPKAGSSVTQP